MYDIVVIGSPTYDIISAPYLDTKKRVLSGSSTMSCSVAARLSLENIALLGTIGPDFRTQFISDIKRIGLPEYVIVNAENTCGFKIVCDVDNGPSRALLDPAGKIGIRDIPDEFLLAKNIILTPAFHEINAELVEWLSSSSEARLLFAPRGLLLRVTNGGSLVYDDNSSVIKTILDSIDAICVNQHESIIISGEKDPFVSAELLSESGIKTVIITLGERGSLIYDNRDFVSIPAIESASKSCLFAGDAYLAAFASQQLSKDNHIESGLFATGVASIVTEEPSFDYPLDTDEIQRRISTISDLVHFH
ncbi:MAG: PfkB family carbohydrate kinase [Candidatus Thorarchaeota archaeon]|jgi:sugar/nucleoside kinase (ribokinase family)